MKVKKNLGLPSIIILFLMASFVLCQEAYAALTSVSLDLPSPTTMSNGSRYYLCSQGATIYDFAITAYNPTATAAADYSYFRLTIPTETAGDIVINYVPSTATTTVTIGGAPVSTVSVNVVLTGSWSNRTVTFGVRADWSVTDNIASAVLSRTITATVQDAASTVNLQDTRSQTYGICSRVRVVGFAQSGQAADGFISPAHAAFNVTGTVAYDIPGYNLETTADAVPDADITSVTAVYGAVNVVAGTGGTATFTKNIGAASIPQNAAFGLAWTVNVLMGGTPQGSTNNLPMECNTAQVTAISFSGGNGVNPPTSDYCFRAYGTTGTSIVLTAQMAFNAGSGLSMHGDTTFTVRFTDGPNTPTFTVTIPSGRTSATVPVPYNDATGFTDAFMATETTVEWTYLVTAISGGTCELNQVNDGNGTPITNRIKWDRQDPPSSGTPAIIIQSASPTATSIRIYWTPLNIPSTGIDRDFYEYRVYYNEVGSPRRQWDGDEDQYLRGLTYNEAVNAAYHYDTATGWKYTTITGLKIFSDYEYYVVAVDIFGNEITEANAGPDPSIVPNPRLFKTQPYSIDVSLTDGVTTYENETFADLTPAIRTLRLSAIRVNLNIVSSEDQPEIVRVWYTNYSTDATIDMVNTGTNTINSGGFPANTLFSADAVRTGPNTFVAYLPTTVPIIAMNNSIRFIVETSLDDISTFSDSTIEAAGVGANPNNGEWTFYIGTAADFKPWPTRILNNVITDKNRVAYPAYYLTDDAKVTITVYDVKGRPVCVILDDAHRKGGQNIKEKGWKGENKAGKKLGVGLYYVHFHAKRSSDNKVILNSFQKVVIAR